MLNVNTCHAEWIKMPRPLLIYSQLDSLIQFVDINSDTKWGNNADSNLLAYWSGSTQSAKAGHTRVQQD